MRCAVKQASFQCRVDVAQMTYSDGNDVRRTSCRTRSSSRHVTESIYRRATYVTVARAARSAKHVRVLPSLCLQGNGKYDWLVYMIIVSPSGLAR